MAAAKWQVSGQYFETCNCDYVCPCISSNMAAKPTKGDCKVALGFQIDKGKFEGQSLDGLKFVVVAMTPGAMGQGNWTVGLIVDEKANEKQREALTAIASGQAGGPMAALGPLISNFAGVEAHPIEFKQDGMKRSLKVAGKVEQSVQGMTSPGFPSDPMVIDHTGHPVNARLALAKATASKFNVFGISLDDTSGNNNGHFAPFSWQG